MKIENINRNDAKRLLEIIDHGLVKGVGVGKPGELCVMAAINLAFGMPHGDTDYGCTDSVVRDLDIRINEFPWSSPQARARGMRREAIAKLGSAGKINNVKFIGLVALGVVNRILPPILEQLHLAKHAEACRLASTLDAADAAAHAAYAAADAANAANAARYASYAASYAANAASYAANAARYAANAARYTANAASYATNAASYAAYAAKAASDAIFGQLCDIATDALIACGSPGAQWIDLCEDAK